MEAGLGYRGFYTEALDVSKRPCWSIGRAGPATTASFAAFDANHPRGLRCGFFLTRIWGLRFFHVIAQRYGHWLADNAYHPAIRCAVLERGLRQGRGQPALRGFCGICADACCMQWALFFPPSQWQKAGCLMLNAGPTGYLIARSDFESLAVADASFMISNRLLADIA